MVMFMPNKRNKRNQVRRGSNVGIKRAAVAHRIAPPTVYTGASFRQRCQQAACDFAKTLVEQEVFVSKINLAAQPPIVHIVHDKALNKLFDSRPERVGQSQNGNLVVHKWVANAKSGMVKIEWWELKNAK